MKTMWGRMHPAADWQSALHRAMSADPRGNPKLPITVTADSLVARALVRAASTLVSPLNDQQAPSRDRRERSSNAA